MNWLVALGIGIGTGLACFSGLWLTLRQAVVTPRRTRRSRLVMTSQLCRLALCALVFCVLSRQGGGTLLSALGGFWLARWHLIQRLGVLGNGR